MEVSVLRACVDRVCIGKGDGVDSGRVCRQSISLVGGGSDCGHTYT